MYWLVEFFGSYYFVTFFITWFSSCIFKAVLKAIREKSPLRLSDGFKGGGIPSSHSATVASITTAVGLSTGFSPIFYVSFVMSLIVILDAFSVRKNVGLQGDAINELLKEFKKPPINVVYGHTFFQVFVGLLWGVFVAFAVFIFY